MHLRGWSIFVLRTLLGGFHGWAPGSLPPRVSGGRGGGGGGGISFCSTTTKDAVGVGFILYMVWMALFLFTAGDWEEEAQGEDLLSDEEGDKEPEDNLDYKASLSPFRGALRARREGVAFD